MVVTSDVSPDAPHLARSANPSCDVHVTNLRDNRLDRTTFGYVGRVIRAPKSVDVWLQNVLLGLDAWSLRVSFLDDDKKPSPGSLPTLQVQVELETVWLSGLATSKAANVVFRFHYLRDGKAVRTETYRGSRTVVNWNNGDKEIQSLLDDAVTQVLVQAQLDIHQLCD